MKKNTLITNIADAVKNHEDYTVFVEEKLRYTLRAFIGLTDGKTEMVLGVEGLPDTTTKLINLGICYTRGKYVYLNRDIYNAIQDKNRNFDELLKKLRSMKKAN